MPLTNLDDPLTIMALDGRPLESGRVSLHTIPLYLQVGDHLETLQFYAIISPEFPLILGFPWLVLHNPQIDWPSTKILKWGPDCDKCLFASSLGISVSPELLQGLVPSTCCLEHALQKGRLFSLLAPERKAMEDYIQESLASSFIHPSTSSAGAGFFFVAKKDNGL